MADTPTPGTRGFAAVYDHRPVARAQRSTPTLITTARATMVAHCRRLQGWTIQRQSREAAAMSPYAIQVMTTSPMADAVIATLPGQGSG